jgi:hypothetical protein
MGLGVCRLMLTVIPSCFHIVVDSISISSFNGIVDFAILVRGGIGNIGSIDRVDPRNSMRPVHGSGQVQGLRWINEAHMESSPGNQLSVSNADKNPPKHKFECKEIKSKQLAWKQIGETISYDHVQKHFPRIASPVFFFHLGHS